MVHDPSRVCNDDDDDDDGTNYPFRTDILSVALFFLFRMSFGMDETDIWSEADDEIFMNVPLAQGRFIR